MIYAFQIETAKGIQGDTNELIRLSEFLHFMREEQPVVGIIRTVNYRQMLRNSFTLPRNKEFLVYDPHLPLNNTIQTAVFPRFPENFLS